MSDIAGDTIFSNLVSTEEVPLAEAATSQELIVETATIVTSSPGFIIRASGEESHSRSAFEASRILAQVTGSDYILDDFRSDVAQDNNAVQLGTGRLHEDAAEGFQDRIIVHKTTSGLGRVSLACSGPVYRELDHKSRALIDLIANRFLQKKGEVDPDIVSPMVHTAILAPGDQVIFPVHNKLGPVWHRFDTLVDPRHASVFVVKPTW